MFIIIKLINILLYRRWLHNVDGIEGCYSGNNWSTEYCPDAVSCGTYLFLIIYFFVLYKFIIFFFFFEATNCALEAVSETEYKTTYGITSEEGELTLKFVTKGEYGDNVGSRVYLMDDSNNYKVIFLILFFP